MSFFEIFAILLTLAAVFGVINYRTIKLPTTIGIMVVTMVFSLLLLAVGTVMPGVQHWAVSLLQHIDFSQVLLHGMLGALLFAGALHVNLNDLISQYRIIACLATFGVLSSTFLIGALTWFLLSLTPLSLSFGYCLLFGALISPTDPIAVLGILKTANAPKRLETKITGESLFNDGVGVVLFLVILEIVTQGQQFDLSNAGLLFFKEVVGGVIIGFAIGYLAYRMLKIVDDYQIEVLITLSVVTGGYVLAETLHLSAPLAIVVAGLLIGNKGREFAMSEDTRVNLDRFWELLDSILNALLFTLLGLEVIAIHFNLLNVMVGVMAIGITLFARFISVSIPVVILKNFREFSPKAIRVLTWGGLRGGISVALALSLPSGTERELILIMTYTVVVFSVIIQGLTIGRLVSSQAN